jgi:hypothetical protein
MMIMKTVVEYAEFMNTAEKVYGASEREEIVAFTSANPKAGREIERFGGIRKLTWKNFDEHRIYFHPGTNKFPLVAIAVFKKGERLLFDKLLEIIIHGKVG